MKVVVLCGGKGIRIRDISGEMPKPMVPIGGYPIVKHILDIYTRHGFDEFVLCLGYRSWQIKEYFLNYQSETQDVEIDFSKDAAVRVIAESAPTPSWKITLAETGLDSQTGSRITKIRKYVGDEPFMLTYGDGVGNVDIGALVEYHKSHGKLVTITAVRPPSRFGKLVVEDHAVVHFEEKPQSGGGLINGGFFVCEPGVFEYLSEDPECSFEQEPLRRLAEDGQLMTFVHEGFWMPMDTSREYQLLNRLCDAGAPPWTEMRPVS